jgi:hypothetical protein
VLLHSPLSSSLRTDTPINLGRVNHILDSRIPNINKICNTYKSYNEINITLWTVNILRKETIEAGFCVVGACLSQKHYNSHLLACLLVIEGKKERKRKAQGSFRRFTSRDLTYMLSQCHCACFLLSILFEIFSQYIHVVKQGRVFLTALAD